MRISLDSLDRLHTMPVSPHDTRRVCETELSVIASVYNG